MFCLNTLNVERLGLFAFGAPGKFQRGTKLGVGGWHCQLEVEMENLRPDCVANLRM